MKQKIALVTGGAGLIGSHLCEELVAKGYKVIAFDNLFSSSKENLQSLVKNKNFKFVFGDVRNKKILQPLIKRVDIVFHLAAILGVSKIVEDPPLTVMVNVIGTENVCELSLKYGKKVVFTSSSDIYGKNQKLPLKETGELIFGESANPRWNYGLTKALSEQVLFAYSKKGLSFVTLRLFNSYGPRCINKSYSHVIAKFILKALKNEPIPVLEDGAQTRTFCYVTDTVRGIILASENLKNETVNIGSSSEVRILSLAKKIIELTGSKSEIIFVPNKKMYGNNFEDTKKRVPDTSKAKKLLKFSPRVKLDLGIKNTIAWVKSTQTA